MLDVANKGLVCWIRRMILPVSNPTVNCCEGLRQIEVDGVVTRNTVEVIKRSNVALGVLAPRVSVARERLKKVSILIRDAVVINLSLLSTAVLLHKKFNFVRKVLPSANQFLDFLRLGRHLPSP